MKLCKSCNVEKDVFKFGKNKAIKDGLNIYCNECKNKKQQERRKLNTPVKEVLPEGFKKCVICCEIKSYNNFNKQKATKDGYNIHCNVCKNKKQRERYNKKDQKPIILTSKICIICKLDKPSNKFNTHKTSVDGLRSSCIKCQSDYRKEYHDIEKNKERSHKQNKKYCDTHKEHRNRIKTERYKNDEQYKIREKILNHTRTMLYSKNDDKYNKLIGCTPSFFRRWLQFQFDEKMTLNNHGITTKTNKKWELEHIIGFSNFDLSDKTQIYMCAHWSNVQPMWGIDNKIKLDRLQLHHVMNSVVNIHRFIQQTQQNKNGYTLLRNRLNFIKQQYN